ncbi:mitogen-activated protein kinase kinase kinase 20-like [Diospyros lotus]|uniref:mitogen-activated protein kinase kinase kinase 20-like n=1 Tax=Diospyros lotus TaxID=55363 RepID=UPI0022546268|nr:mitogen-activated protein kinase kinase kinase 20-like [Diospyros lotus]
MQWSRGEKLGSGASGTVYVAHVLQDQCSIKNGLPSNVMAVKSAEVEWAGPLLKEKKLLTRFQSCPHVIRCFGDNITDENGVQMYNLWLEYASGGSLADRLTRLGRGLSEDEVRKHTQSVLKGLRHLHMQGYVHCDLKPHNILLVQEDAKIADLGSAKKAGNTLKKKQRKPSLRGTPMYMAPESIRQQDYQPETDIWALGCTVLQLITGKEPWRCDPGMASVALMYRIASTDKVPEIPSAELMSSEVRDFLNKCLVRDPKSRWTADELLGHPFLSATQGIQEQSNKKALAVHEGKKATHSSPMSQSSLGQLIRPNLILYPSVVVACGERRRIEKEAELFAVY